MATDGRASDRSTNARPELRTWRNRSAWLRLSIAMVRRDMRRERLPVLLVAAAAAGAMYAMAFEAMQDDPFFDAILRRLGSVSSFAAVLAVAIAVFGTCSRVAEDQRRGWVEPVVTNGRERVAYLLAALATMTVVLFVLYVIAVAGAGITAGAWPETSAAFLGTTLLRIAAGAAWGAAAALLLPAPGNGALALVAFMLGPILVFIRYAAASMEPPAAVAWASTHSLLMVVMRSDASLAIAHLLLLAALLLLIAERTVARSV